MDDIAVFEKLKPAKKFFNKVKKDTKNLFSNIKKKFFDCFVIKSLVTFLFSFVDTIKSSVFCFVITSYDKLVDSFDKSFFGTFIRKLNNLQYKPMRQIREAAARSNERNPLLKFSKFIIFYLLKLNLQSYGLFLLVLGLGFSAINLAKSYYFDSYVSYYRYAIGILLLLLSLPFFSSKKSLALALKESSISNVLFKTLGISTISIDEVVSQNEVRTNFLASFIVGLLIAAASYFVNPTYLGLGILALFALGMIFSRPEFGLSILFIAFPFFNARYIIVFIIILSVAMLYKVVIGKRVISITFVDILVFFTLLIIIASSIFNIANVDETRLFITTAVIFAYFLSKNLLKESSQRVSCINCLIFSSTMISIFGILERIFGSQLYEWTELKTLNYYVNHITSFFESSTTLSIYLVVMIPLIIGQLLNSKFGIKFVLLLFSLIVNITCLIFTKEIISGLVLLVIVLLMFALINKKFFILYLLSIPPIAVLIAFFKDPLSKLIEVERNAFIERFTINHSIVSFFQKYNVIGIGGGNAFSRVYPLFAENGNYAITSLCNTYFQVFLEYGIFGIILVVAILFIFAQMAMYCYVKSNTTKENKMFSLSIFIAMLGLVLLGFTSYIFIDIRVFLMFFLLLGLCTAHTNEVLSFERTNINNIYE